MAVESGQSSAGSGDGGDIYQLPEGCIANVLSLTSPRDASRLSVVATIFRSAAESDAVWDRFLPPDYSDIIYRSSDGAELVNVRSKKELYLYLCDHPLFIDGGTKVLSDTVWVLVFDF